MRTHTSSMAETLLPSGRKRSSLDMASEMSRKAALAYVFTRHLVLDLDGYVGESNRGESSSMQARLRLVQSRLQPYLGESGHVPNFRLRGHGSAGHSTEEAASDAINRREGPCNYNLPLSIIIPPSTLRPQRQLIVTACSCSVKCRRPSRGR
jgi:hypothetical protein